MALVVYDYGLRVQTPWYDIFPPRDVNRVTGTPATLALNRHDQIRPPPLSLSTKEDCGNSNHRGDKGVAAYQDVVQERVQQRLSAADIMSASPLTLLETASLSEAWWLFRQRGVRHIPVLNIRNKLCGLLSERDLLRGTSTLTSDAYTRASLVSGLPNKSTVVSELMSRQVITAALTTSLRDIAVAMGEYKIGAVPVLDANELLVGIVTRSDVIKVIVQNVMLDLWG